MILLDCFEFSNLVVQHANSSHVPEQLPRRISRGRMLGDNTHGLLAAP